MTMTDWFLAELESEAAKSRRVLDQVADWRARWRPRVLLMGGPVLSVLVLSAIGSATSVPMLAAVQAHGRSAAEELRGEDAVRPESRLQAGAFGAWLTDPLALRGVANVLEPVAVRGDCGSRISSGIDSTVMRSPRVRIAVTNMPTRLYTIMAFHEPHASNATMDPWRLRWAGDSDFPPTRTRQ